MDKLTPNISIDSEIYNKFRNFVGHGNISSTIEELIKRYLEDSKLIKNNGLSDEEKQNKEKEQQLTEASINAEANAFIEEIERVIIDEDLIEDTIINDYIFNLEFNRNIPREVKLKINEATIMNKSWWLDIEEKRKARKEQKEVNDIEPQEDIQNVIEREEPLMTEDTEEIQ